MMCIKNSIKAVRSFPILGSMKLFSCVSDRSVTSNTKPRQAPGSNAKKINEISVSCTREKSREIVAVIVT